MRLDWVGGLGNEARRWRLGNEARLGEDWGMRLDWVRTGK